MLDVIYLAVSFGLFALCVGYCSLADRGRA